MSAVFEINQKFIKESVDKLDKADIDFDNIPDMQFYMEQLTDFLNKNAGGTKRADTSDNQADVLTKAMINNYTRNGILNPPDKKKYNREHIVLLLMINQLKNILTIKDIKKLFAPILKNMNTTEVDDTIISLKDIYTTFLKLKDDEYKDAAADFDAKFSIIKEKTSQISDEKNQDLAEAFMIVMMLVAEANIAKRLAENIIDNLPSIMQRNN